MGSSIKKGVANDWNNCIDLMIFLHSYMCRVAQEELITEKRELNGYQIFSFHVRNMHDHFPCLTLIQFYRVSKYFPLQTLISRGLFNLEMNILHLPRALP